MAASRPLRLARSMHSSAGVKLAHLKKIPESSAVATDHAGLRMRGTDAQDAPVPADGSLIARERLRLAEVSRGHFVRDRRR